MLTLFIIIKMRVRRGRVARERERKGPERENTGRWAVWIMT